MFSKTIAFCPVCDSTLGYLTKGQVCSFVCQDCQFIYSWDTKGKLGAPIKMNPKKAPVCGCASCEGRNEQKYYKDGDPNK